MPLLRNVDDLRAYCRDKPYGDEAVLTVLLEFIHRHTRSECVVLSFIDYADPKSLWFRKIYTEGQFNSSTYHTGLRLAIGTHDLPRSLRSTAGWVAATRQPVFSGDVLQTPYYLSIDDNVRSEMAVPVLCKEILIGVLTVESYRPDQYTDDDCKWLINVAAIVAECLEGTWRQEGWVYRRRRVLADFATLCARPFGTSHAFLEAALKQIVSSTDAQDSYVRVVDHERLILKVSYSLDPTVIPPSFHNNLFLRIGRREELAESERSFAGHVAATRRPQRNGEVHNGLTCDVSVPLEIHSILGAPILFREDLLGVIMLHHTERNFFTAQHEEYLAALTDLLAVPLQGLLASERPRLSQQEVRTAIQATLRGLEAEHLFAKPQVVSALAKHIATALGSKLCTIWLLNPVGRLTWHGAYGLSPIGLPQAQTDEAEALQGLQDVFGPLPEPVALEQEASATAVAWQALHAKTLCNYGPNHDEGVFREHGFRQPFLLVPLLTREAQSLGVIHVGVKEHTPTNPQGIYTEADEHLLESLQMEIVDLYERQLVRETAEYAAQDLHDALGLMTYDLIYGIDALRYAWKQRKKGRVEALLQDLEHKAQSLTGEIRAVMGALQSHILEDEGLVNAVRHYISDHVARPGLEVDISTTGKDRVPIKIAWHLYRIAQEALTNIVKHARATQAHCAFRFTATSIGLRVRDNGQGFARAESSNGYGLRNIQRRVEGLGGRVRIHHSSTSGTILQVTIPQSR